MEQPRPPNNGTLKVLAKPKFLILSQKNHPNQNILFFLEKIPTQSKFLVLSQKSILNKTPYTLSKKKKQTPLKPRPSKPGLPKLLTQSKFLRLCRKNQLNQNLLSFLKKTQPNQFFLYFLAKTNLNKISYTFLEKTNSAKTWVTQIFDPTKIFYTLPKISYTFPKKPTKPRFFILSGENQPPESV